MFQHPSTSLINPLPYGANRLDPFSDGDFFLQAPSIRRIPLNNAPNLLRERRWKRGVYVIFRGPKRVYVGSSFNLPIRLGQHRLSVNRMGAGVENYKVKVFHFPTANRRTLEAREDEYRRRFPGRYSGLRNNADDLFF